MTGLQGTPLDNGKPRTIICHALDGKAQHAVVLVSLHCVRDKGLCRGHTRHRLNTVLKIPGQLGDLCKRALGILLHHPDICPGAVYDERGLLNEPPVDTAHAHHHNEQQADARGGQQETPQIVAYILECQINH